MPGEEASHHRRRRRRHHHHHLSKIHLILANSKHVPRWYFLNISMFVYFDMARVQNSRALVSIVLKHNLDHKGGRWCVASAVLVFP